jgi:hypothetical protein
MNHYVSLLLTSRKSSVHLHALYSPCTALRMFTARRDKLVICGQYVLLYFSQFYRVECHICYIQYFSVITVLFQYRIKFLLSGTSGGVCL